MRTWSLVFDNPPTIRLAADARLTTPSYVDDQIWEVTLGGGDPPALGFQTTYGLRARGMRLFPTIAVEGEHITDPARFHTRLTLHAAFPNYLRVDFRPRPEIEVWAGIECPVADRRQGGSSSTIMPRIPGGCVWRSTVFRPGDRPRPIRETTLEGPRSERRDGDLAPVVFMAAGRPSSWARIRLAVSHGSSPRRPKPWSGPRRARYA
jgi:hypothetical protein